MKSVTIKILVAGLGNTQSITYDPRTGRQVITHQNVSQQDYTEWKTRYVPQAKQKFYEWIKPKLLADGWSFEPALYNWKTYNFGNEAQLQVSIQFIDENDEGKETFMYYINRILKQLNNDASTKIVKPYG